MLHFSEQLRSPRSPPAPRCIPGQAALWYKHSIMQLDVSLFRTLEYESTLLDRGVGVLLDECGTRPGPGMDVLVKPNLVARTKAHLSCSHPRVVAAVCKWLQDCGARVIVADSPAFGSASSVAAAAGMNKALAPLGLKVKTLGDPVKTPLTLGGHAGIARRALEADHLFNVARLKAHIQFRMSAAVKNLFGCVVGFRKAVAHTRHGQHPGHLESMVADVYEALPQSVHLLDGVYAMHRTGPVKGEPHNLGLLGASVNGVALDAAVYHILGLAPDQVPLWAEFVRRGEPGTDPEDLHYPLEQPDAFDGSGFEVPPVLDAMEFEPVRLVRGRLKSVLHTLTGK